MQRAILVDPYNRTIREVWGEFATTFRLVNQYLATGGEGHEHRPSEIGPVLAAGVWFYTDMVAVNRPSTPAWSLTGWPVTIRGRGLLCQHQGDTIVGLSHTVQPAMLAELVTFEQPEGDTIPSEGDSNG